MRIKDALKNAREILEACGNEDHDFDARCLCEYCFEMCGTKLALSLEREADEQSVKKLKELVKRRCSGEPLQYILGEWEFMGKSFFVGEGVLIPRPETELLVETVSGYIKNSRLDKFVVYDLCAGSGCIGISIALQNPKTQVFAVEKYGGAFNYLEKNIKRYALKNIHAQKGDILTSETRESLPTADVILSNPPYIKSGEIASLQAELSYEPVCALDGGEDGLLFYRALVSWLDNLSPTGIMALEIGDEQAEDIEKLFKNRCGEIKIIKDYSGHDRIALIKM